MRSEAYSAILYALAEGIHPVTGDLLPEGLIDQPELIRALYAGARVLEIGCQGDRAAKSAAGSQEPAARMPNARGREQDARKQAAGKPGDRPSPKPGRENAGKPWSKEDDALLMENYSAGTSVNSLAKTFKRTAFAIEARLEKLESSRPGAQRRAYGIVSASGAIDVSAPQDAPRSPAASGTQEP